MLTKEDLNNIKNLIEGVVEPMLNAFRKEIGQRFKEQNEYIDRCFQNQAELIKQTYLPRDEFEKYRKNVKDAFILADSPENSMKSKRNKNMKTTSGKI
jgi:hypothetical protein